MLEGVANEVADGLRERVRIGLDHSIGHRAQLQTAVRDRLNSLELLGEKPPDSHGFQLEAASLLCAGQEQQAVHKPLHPVDLRGDHCLDAADVFRADVG